MDLYEYQARDIFERYHVPVVPGLVATTPTQAEQAARVLGGKVVVKAQVKTGGRGKAGGVKVAADSGEAKQAADDILGMKIKDHTVRRVMVAKAVDIAEEYYFSILLDRRKRRYLALLSKEGGVDIETLAKERPEAIVMKNFTPLDGMTTTLAREMAQEAGFSNEETASLVPVLKLLYGVYDSEDATLVEVNPLVKTVEGKFIALDGKVSLDSNANFRHPEHAALADYGSMDPLEAKAMTMGLNYVKLDGSVGVIGNGAGLVMSTLDVVAAAGAEFPSQPTPANFLDIGGGANADVMADGLEVILGDPQVESIFVNVFGGITACDEVANGIRQAYRILKSEGIEPKPLVVRLDGNKAAEGRAILDKAQLPLLEQVGTMDLAARRAAEIADAAGGQA